MLENFFLSSLWDSQGRSQSHQSAEPSLLRLSLVVGVENWSLDDSLSYAAEPFVHWFWGLDEASRLDLALSVCSFFGCLLYPIVRPLPSEVYLSSVHSVLLALAVLQSKVYLALKLGQGVYCHCHLILSH